MVRGKLPWGFSLVELMVAVGIVGILATLAMPRYKSFMAQARRGEARLHLHTIHALQENYKVEHSNHYAGLKVGYFLTGSECDDVDDSDNDLDNKLGFRPNDCEHLRYGYTSSGGGRAFAPSNKNKRWIYPDCNGAGSSECGSAQGDIVTMFANGTPVVCRNINKYCPPGTIPPVTTPPLCPANTCCDASGNPITSCKSNPNKSWLGYPDCKCGICTNTSTCSPPSTLNANCVCVAVCTDPTACGNTTPVAGNYTTTCEHPSWPSGNYTWTKTTSPCGGSFTCSLSRDADCTDPAKPKFDASTCSCIAQCTTTTQCCDNQTTEHANDASHYSLTCTSWKGTFASGSLNKGCCVCGGTTPHWKDNGTSGGCCANATDTWDGTQCVVACGDQDVCENYTTPENGTWSSKCVHSSWAPNTYTWSNTSTTTSPPTCQGEFTCSEEKLCDKAGGTWTGSTCEHKTHATNYDWDKDISGNNCTGTLECKADSTCPTGEQRDTSDNCICKVVSLNPGTCNDTTKSHYCCDSGNTVGLKTSITCDSTKTLKADASRCWCECPSTCTGEKSKQESDCSCSCPGTTHWIADTTSDTTNYPDGGKCCANANDTLNGGNCVTPCDDNDANKCCSDSTTEVTTCSKSSIDNGWKFDAGVLYSPNKCCDCDRATACANTTPVAGTWTDTKKSPTYGKQNLFRKAARTFRRAVLSAASNLGIISSTPCTGNCKCRRDTDPDKYTWALDGNTCKGAFTLKSCDNTTQCCDTSKSPPNDVKTKSAVCPGNKYTFGTGTYSSSSDDHGCCECNYTADEYTQCNNKSSYTTWHPIKLNDSTAKSCECTCDTTHKNLGFSWDSTLKDCIKDSTIYTNCFTQETFKPDGINDKSNPLYVPGDANIAINLNSLAWLLSDTDPYACYNYNYNNRTTYSTAAGKLHGGDKDVLEYIYNCAKSHCDSGNTDACAFKNAVISPGSVQVDQSGQTCQNFTGTKIDLTINP